MSYFSRGYFNNNIKSTNLNSYNVDLTNASTDYKVLSKPTNGNIGLSTISVYVPSGLTAGTVTLKDDDGINIMPFHTCKTVNAGEAEIVLDVGSLPIRLKGDLIANSDTSGVKISSFGVIS